MAILVRFFFFRALGLTWLYVPFQWIFLSHQGWSATVLLGLNALFCLAAVACEVPTGVLADHYGRRPLFLCGAVNSVAASVLFATCSDQLAGLGAANLAAALAMTCISGTDSAYLYEWLAWSGRLDRYRWAESVAGVASLGGSALAAVLASLAVARGMPLVTLYWGTAGVALAGGLLALSLPEPWAQASRGDAQPGARGTRLGAVVRLGKLTVGQTRETLVLVASRRDLLGLALFSALLFPLLRLGLLLDQPYARQLGFGVDALGWLYGAKDLCAALGAALSVRLVAVWGERRLLTALPLWVALSLAGMAVARGSWAVALVVLPTLAFGTFSPLVRCFVNRRLGADLRRAAVLSTEGMARRVGFAIFSPLVGVVIDLWSLQAALAVSSLWALGALLAVAFMGLSRGDRESHPLRVGAPAP